MITGTRHLHQGPSHQHLIGATDELMYHEGNPSKTIATRAFENEGHSISPVAPVRYFLFIAGENKFERPVNDGIEIEP